MKVKKNTDCIDTECSDMTIIPITPIAKPRMTVADRWKKRPIILRYWEYKDNLKELGIRLEQNMSYYFFLPMPKSWSKKKRAMKNHTLHDCRGRNDLDNLLKGFWDAIAEEDSYLASVRGLYKFWSDTPGIIILYNG